MCYNFATFVLYLDVITLIYRENRLTSSETCLSAHQNKGQDGLLLSCLVYVRCGTGIKKGCLPVGGSILY